MALLDKDERRIATGIVIGAGLAWAAPHLMPALMEAAKPVLKAVLKLGVVGLERGREAAAHMQETMSDTWAEVQAELEDESGLPPEEVELQQTDVPATEASGAASPRAGAPS